MHIWIILLLSSKDLHRLFILLYATFLKRALKKQGETDLGKHFHSIPVPEAAVAAFFQVIEPYHVFLRNAMPPQELERREWIDLRARSLDPHSMKTGTD